MDIHDKFIQTTYQFHSYCIYYPSRYIYTYFLFLYSAYNISDIAFDDIIF